MSLPRYPAYRDSGVTWLGETPAHWAIVPLKYVVSLRSGGTPDKSNPAYWDGSVPWASAKDLKVDTLQDTADHITEEAVSCGAAALVPVGAVLVVVRGMILARLFPVVVAKAPMAINQDLKAVVAGNRLHSDFLAWLLRGSEAESLSRLDEAGHGTKALRMDTWGAMQLPVPALQEQTAIATFLDRETAKIDALIAEQEKLIALLAEKRQATISHAVTRGLNPDAPMKDSGVRWLGEMPAHWEVKSLGRVAVERCDGPFGSGIKSEHYTDEGALVIRLQNIRAGAFNVGEPVYLDEAYFRRELQGHAVMADDLLVAGLGDDNNLLGRACVAPPGLGPALVKADCFRFRLDPEVALSAFVAVQLSAGAAFDAGMLATGTTRSRIPLGVMSTRKLVLPPIAEQRQIADFVCVESRKLDELSSGAVHAIELLRERRSSLIAAAVTGQIDVRGAVPTCEEA